MVVQFSHHTTFKPSYNHVLNSRCVAALGKLKLAAVYVRVTSALRRLVEPGGESGERASNIFHYTVILVNIDFRLLPLPGSLEVLFQLIKLQFICVDAFHICHRYGSALELGLQIMCDTEKVAERHGIGVGRNGLRRWWL